MTDTYTPKTDLSGKAKEVVRDVKAKAAGMTEDITKAAKDNAAQLGNSAREFASAAKDKVGEAVSQRKSIGADYIGSIAQVDACAHHVVEFTAAGRPVVQRLAKLHAVTNTAAVVHRQHKVTVIRETPGCYTK